MSNRWKMNRIGFVNFWLYDEEYFEFADGKLLLRGQNGSGKSITTQSFIPFILDGDRTPSRLDPFGSSDRRMEYYFLGEEGKDEATGYLFLEFKKEEEEAYRTIGIGQRAKRGKPMDFWGFVVLDGQRIGYDLQLYKEVGKKRIPYDKREMKLLLGEQNLFTGSQSEYKKLVNQYIFGFRKEEQYEQFIKLLVKVRAPKLSKEFKPTKVYDILNESLQTLSDEDLRVMVDAMEKMDEIQDSLDMLNRAFADVKIIRTEYTRYNQYMLAKKAQSYLNKKEEAKKAQWEYDAQLNRKESLILEQQDIEKQLAELLEQEKLAETERNSLFDTDLEEMDRKLEAAKKYMEQAAAKLNYWEEKIEEYKARVYEKERELKEIKQTLEQHQKGLENQKEELEANQEIMQWDGHANAIRLIGTKRTSGTEEVSASLFMYQKLVEECVKIIQEYEELSEKYDEIAEEFEGLHKNKIKQEQSLEAAKKQMVQSTDNWIMELYAHAKAAEQWNPKESVLQEAEDLVRAYQNISDAGKVQELLRGDYEAQWQELLQKKNMLCQKEQASLEALERANQELSMVQNQTEIEPYRNERTVESRKALEEAGITAVPFYKAVEFAEYLEDAACAKLEAQLECMGILDALVVAQKDLGKIEKYCPRFFDAVIFGKEKGSSNFRKLVVNPELDVEIQKSVEMILSNIHEEQRGYDNIHAGCIYMGTNGQFAHGMLVGKADKKEAEFLGRLARAKKKAQQIKKLQAAILDLQSQLQQNQAERKQAEADIGKLQAEYKEIPDFEEINLSLEREKACILEMERVTAEFAKCEQRTRECAEKKNAKYQVMLQKCRPFPYGRTKMAYNEVLDCIKEYEAIWQTCKGLLLRLETNQSDILTRQDYLEQDEQRLDEAFIEKRECSTKVKEYEIQIRQYEEYLMSPEIAQKAQRLEALRKQLAEIQKNMGDLKEMQVRSDEKLKHLLESEPSQKLRLQELIAEETVLCKCFEEELGLKLVLAKEEHTLPECARMAVRLLRESDKNREYGDMLQSLIQVYQKHNGSLTNYGTALEDCFEALEVLSGVGEDFQALRKRVRVVSAWNGKKVYLEEFYQILKASIEETQLLIQQKDRELFEDILSQTISQQLTDKIAESRKWVSDMSKLMKKLDTSMGLSFSLEWKPRSAENETELDTAELEKILLRDYELLTIEDIQKVAGHFRSKIRVEKLRLEEDGGVINYMELVRDALDYRKWFEFRMFYKRGEETKRPLTNAAFNRFSGGEKAMAMYVPLFAAVNAQYKKADNEEHPRMIALDEAFAGVDDKNISSMFELVHKMDFDYIMNSQSLWGCYETVKGIKIAELHRPMNSQVVTVIRYMWNGHERILDVQ
uniref:TIGR02680 family protein n=1 Tax=Agathobacter sp. TaxID=2021311 RepID=UPI004055F0E3